MRFNTFVLLIGLAIAALSRYYEWQLFGSALAAFGLPALMLIAADAKKRYHLTTRKP